MRKVYGAMNPSDLFWSASLEEMKKGYLFDPGADQYRCLFCGRGFARGYIHQLGDALLEAEKAAAVHVEREHGSAFGALLRLEKEHTGLTELQRELLGLFHQGAGDEAVAAALGIGSRSTVRNHRFALREREKQARVFLAIMELLGERQSAERAAPPRKERAGEAGPVKALPRREKKRQAMVEAAAGRFEAGRDYPESEVNGILETVCEDYGTLRRELIDRGILARERDGSLYRLKAGAIPRESAMDRKELIQQYKSTVRPAGVYQVRNTVNGRVLVGSSLNLDGRRNRFGFEVKTGSIGNNAELNRDWKAFGAEAFVFEVLEELEAEDPQHDYRDELAELEKKWLEKLQPYGERGYNRLPR